MVDRRAFLQQSGRLALAATVANSFARPLMAEEPAITVAAVGDCMITRPLSNLQPNTFLPLAQILRGADVSFGNFEMTLADASAAPAYHEDCAYVHLRADMPDNRILVDELKWAGFRMMGLANNHSMDYGAEGLLTTIEKFDAAGLAHAGTGRNLAQARAPAYYDSGKGRIGLVACASTFPEGALAADGNGEIPGRPGINPLRVVKEYRINSEQFGQLRKIAGSLGIKDLQPDDSGTFSFLGQRFRTGSDVGVVTAADSRDTAAIGSSIRRAKRAADLVMLGIHAHESGSSIDVPAQFLQPFAHDCIDAGASMLIGHGPHVLRGIEIYRGCPIFYSLGNFIFHGESEKQIPPEIYQTCGVSGNDPSDVFDKVLRGFSAGPYWVAVIALATFRQRKLKDLRLYPVTLQPELSRARRGTPMPADPQTGRQIIEKLAQLSAPYGTRIQYRDGVGIVEIGTA